ncbi:MAG: hypothetical protein HOQ29_19820 [Acidobacteria bacterium]|nr:hypothetical protein [Acidobacteriota bacterium]
MRVGPGAGDEGGHIVVSGTPADVAANRRSRTAPYLARAMGHSSGKEEVAASR